MPRRFGVARQYAGVVTTIVAASCRTVIHPCVGFTAALLLAACGGGGSSPPPPTVSINVSPSSIPAGQTATLTWSSTNASACTASGAWTDPVSTSGSLGVSPSAPATYTYNLSCSSSGSSAATGSAALTVVPAQLAITTAALANGVIGTPYDATIQATGGVAPFAWAVSSGALPHNLSLSTSTTNSVTISGTPDTVAQAVPFTIQVTDSGHHTASQPFTISILLQADSLVLSPASLDFGNQLLGTASGALAETLTNTATSAMFISSIAISGSNAAEFNQTSTTCGASLAAGASCAVNLSFTPTQPGPRNAALTITDDTAGSPQSVPLNGLGLTAGPNATLSVAGVTFGTQLVGTTSPAMSVALTNYGSVTLNVGSIVESTTSFAETDNCVGSLASQATCVISVTFTAGGSGPTTGMLSISDDAPGSPQNVSLSGTGSTNTPLLTGHCFATCIGSVEDPAQCPVGQPAETPGSVPVYPCGVIGGFVRVDRARGCLVRAPSHFGHCQTQ